MSIDRWRVPKGSGTHLLMDGGILYVPSAEINDFYKEYIACVNLGTKLYVVEQKTEHFKFFVDLDYKAPEKLKDEDLLQFCSIIHQAIETSSQCLIARAHPRPVKEGIKSGVHIHWPGLIVTRTQALNLRTKIIMSLTSDFPFDWDKIIDASVYSGSGLRMLWSHKKPTGDPYIPWKELNGSRDFQKQPDLDVLALFAIRTEDDERTTEVLADTGALEQFIQKYMEGQGRSRIKKVQRHENDGWFAQTDSKFCERIHGNHKNNHVWFHISSRRISQRCFDEECREFCGEKVILSPSIVEQLNDVAIVGSPSNSFIMDVFPNGAASSVQKVRKDGAPVLGSRSGQLGTISAESAHVRTVGFNPVG